MLSTKEQKQMKDLRETNTVLQVKLQHYANAVNKIKDLKMPDEISEKVNEIMKEADDKIKADIG